MIYEQISDLFQSLANQWHDLAESFRRLASQYPEASVTRIALLGRPQNPGDPARFAFLCDHEGTDIVPPDAGGLFQTTRSAALLIKPTATPNAIQTVIALALSNLQAAEQSRQDLENSF